MNDELQRQIDMVISAASQFCHEFTEAIEKFSDEINEACVSIQKAWDELRGYFDDLIQVAIKKRKPKWTEKKIYSLKSVMLDKRPKVYHCRNAC